MEPVAFPIYKIVGISTVIIQLMITLRAVVVVPMAILLVVGDVYQKINIAQTDMDIIIITIPYIILVLNTNNLL
jgi:hypothetical protein